MDFQIQLNFPEDEHWQWIEVYENEAIPQYNENGISRHFKDIDQDNLIKFVMMHESGKQVIIPKVNDSNWRLIHFFHRVKGLSTTGKEKTSFKYPIAGYQITKDNVNFKSLHIFLDSGNIQAVYR